MRIFIRLRRTSPRNPDWIGIPAVRIVIFSRSKSGIFDLNLRKFSSFHSGTVYKFGFKCIVPVASVLTSVAAYGTPNPGSLPMRHSFFHTDSEALFRSVVLFFCLFFLLTPGDGWALADRPFPKPRGPVNDFANVIPRSDEDRIESVASELYTKTGVPVVLVTMADIGGAEYNDYANRLYEAWAIGKKGEDKGVLIFVTVKERKMRIEVGYGLEGVIPDGLAGEIRDRYMVPYLRKERYGEGLLNGTYAIAAVIARDAGVKLTGAGPVKSPRKRRSGLSIFPFIFIFLILMFASRRRGGSWLFFLPILLGRGGSYGFRYGSGFGGFSGGFGGFGGGMSGGGGAGGSF
jgi:uncharacterized protein